MRDYDPCESDEAIEDDRDYTGYYAHESSEEKAERTEPFKSIHTYDYRTKRRHFEAGE